MFGRKTNLLLLMLAAAALSTPGRPACAQGTTGTARMLVVYRHGVVPEDADTATLHAGGLLLRRHVHSGTALVTASPDAAVALRRDPRVAFVVNDRALAATELQVRPGDTVTNSGPVMRASAPSKSFSPEGADAMYRDSPQGWAVRTTGGYGGGIAGSASDGPWSLSTGRGVRIAVLDSGVDQLHPDLLPNLALNLSEVDRTQQPSPCDDASPQDQSGHGTWVASLAAAAAGASTGMTVGVAPDASILNIKVLQRVPGNGVSLADQCRNGQASGMLSWVLQGIEDAVAWHADVIVLSMAVTLDLYSGDDAGVKASFDSATHAAAAAGAVLVAAAGNDAVDFSNTRYVSVPAQSRDVLAVVASTNPACAETLLPGATCAAGPVTLPYYSNYGAPLHAVAAPGGSYPLGSSDGVSGWVRGACSAGIHGTADGPPQDASHSEGCFNLGHAQYAQAIGTSASAPLVAGVLALVKAAHPGWDAATLVAAVRASAIPAAGSTVGVVNAAAAIAYQP